MFGQRLRHARRAKGLTLADLGAKVGRTPVGAVADRERPPRAEAVAHRAARRRARRASRPSCCRSSRRAAAPSSRSRWSRRSATRRTRRSACPSCGSARGCRASVIEHLLALHGELRGAAGQADRDPRGGPRGQRRRCAAMMRERGNYFAEIEEAAAGALAAAGYAGGALSQGMLLSVVASTASPSGSPADLPRSVRSRDRPARPAGSTSSRSRSACTPPRAVLLQTLGHFVLGHGTPARLRRLPAPAGRGQLLRRRGAGARAGRRPVPARRQGPPGPGGGGPARRVLRLLRDGRAPVHQPGHPSPGRALPLREERRGRRHLQGLRRTTACVFPADATGAIEGQRMCRQWSGRQVFAAADRFSPVLPVLGHAVGHLLLRRRRSTRARRAGFAITLGVPFERLPLVPRPRDDPPHQVDAARTATAASARPPRSPSAGRAWPGRRPARTRHVLSALPSGAFPGVDDADIYEFLDRHAGD